MFAKIQEMLTVREEIPKRSSKLVELTQFTEAEPGNLYVKMIQKLKKIAASKIKEFVDICSRPIVHPQVWEQVDAKLKEYKVKTKFTPGQFYDPMSPAAEITTFTEQIKSFEQIEARAP